MAHNIDVRSTYIRSPPECCLRCQSTPSIVERVLVRRRLFGRLRFNLPPRHSARTHVAPRTASKETSLTLGKRTRSAASPAHAPAWCRPDLPSSTCRWTVPADTTKKKEIVSRRLPSPEAKVRATPAYAKLQNNMAGIAATRSRTQLLQSPRQLHD